MLSTAPFRLVTLHLEVIRSWEGVGLDTVSHISIPRGHGRQSGNSAHERKRRLVEVRRSTPANLLIAGDPEIDCPGLARYPRISLAKLWITKGHRLERRPASPAARSDRVVPSRTESEYAGHR